MSGKTKGIVAIVVSAFGFALMAMCVRLCDDYGSPVPCFEKSFFRNIAALVIAMFAVVMKGWAVKGVGPRELGVLSVRCVLGTIGIFANFYALSRIPIADGQTLNKTAPFFTVIFTWIFLGERVSFRQMASVLLAFVGAIFVIKPGFAGADAFPLAMGLLGGVCAGGAYAAVRVLGAKKVNPVLIVFAFSMFSCLISLPLTWAVYVPLTGKQIVILCGAGLGAAIGQFGITFAYRFAAPREIAVYDYINIVFTALMGYLVFGQVSDEFAFLGMGIIILAAMLLNRHNFG